MSGYDDEYIPPGPSPPPLPRGGPRYPPGYQPSAHADGTPFNQYTPQIPYPRDPSGSGPTTGPEHPNAGPHNGQEERDVYNLRNPHSPYGGRLRVYPEQIGLLDGSRLGGQRNRTYGDDPLNPRIGRVGSSGITSTREAGYTGWGYNSGYDAQGVRGGRRGAHAVHPSEVPQLGPDPGSRPKRADPRDPRLPGERRDYGDARQSES